MMIKSFTEPALVDTVLCIDGYSYRLFSEGMLRCTFLFNLMGAVASCCRCRLLATHTPLATSPSMLKPTSLSLTCGIQGINQDQLLRHCEKEAHKLKRLYDMLDKSSCCRPKGMMWRSTSIKWRSSEEPARRPRNGTLPLSSTSGGGFRVEPPSSAPGLCWIC